ncbi:MAG: TonB-dependent receptor [Bergeyella sp.]
MRKINNPLPNPVSRNKAALFFALTFLPLGLMNAQKSKKDTLKEKTIEEVVLVNIGYGKVKKEQVNSSVSTVKKEDIQNLQQVSVDQMLQGKASGVTVVNNSGQPGSSASVRVRGTGSLTGSNEPLYIIDGVPFSGDATNKSTSGRPIAGSDFTSQGNNAVSPLALINPGDIENIEILKDAAATAIYGSRGANGVVIITTKSGKKGQGKLTYDYTMSLQTPAKYLDMMNLQEYARLQNALTAIYGLEPRQDFLHPELLGQGTNWQRELFQTAAMQNHQLSFSGGNENSTYYISAGYLDQDGIVIGSGFKRYSFRTNLDTKVKSWLKTGVNFSASVTDEDVTLNGSYNGLVATALLMAPDVPVRNPDGSYAGAPQNDASAFINPVALALSKTNNLIRKNFFGNLYAEATLTKGLTYRLELGGNTEFADNREFTPSYEWGQSVNEYADLYVRKNDYYSWNLKNILNYNRTFGKHDINALLGQEAMFSKWQGVQMYGTGFVSNSIPSLSVADPDTISGTEYFGKQSMISLFARLVYTYDQRYSITASYRADGSSKFDSGNKWGFFPGLSGSWNIAKESFMENARHYINTLKLKAGYGTTGNQQVGNYLYGTSISATGTGLGTGFMISNILNPDLQWETQKQTNLGVDLAFLSNRLTASFDWYNKISSDFLYQNPLPDYVTGGQSWEGGVAAPTVNMGEMQNKGYDISIGYTTKGNKDFTWSSNFNFSHYKNTVSELAVDNLTKTINTNGYLNITATQTLQGLPMGQFYGYIADGIFRNDSEITSGLTYFGSTPQLGDVKYVDVSGDGIINESDRTFIGSPHPDFTFGFTNNFRYKFFDFSVFVQGSYGNDIINLTKRLGTSLTGLYRNQLSEAADYWSADNPNASNPRPVAAEDHPNLFLSSRHVEDGSYLRIQNVTLGFTVPKDFTEKYRLNKLRFFVSAQNLYTITDYSGYDPEVGSINQDALVTGIDNGRYPTPRVFSMGLNVEF